MRHLLLIYIIIILLPAGCKKRGTGMQEFPPPEISVHSPVRQDVVYSYEYPAYIEAEQTVELVARVTGFLEEIVFTPGQVVKAGQTLFVIEPRPYIDQVNAAKAQIKSAQAQLAYTQAAYEKMKDAREGNAVSEIDYIRSESDYHTAMAGLQDAQAQLNTARTNLTYCYIKAPFDGRVSRNLVDRANYVGSPLQPTHLATIFKDRQMYIYFNMAYTEYQNLPALDSTVGRDTLAGRVWISDVNRPEKKWSGKIDYSSPDVDLQTGTVNLRAIVQNPEHELLSGMYVKINVPYKKVKDALLIPESSIGTNQSGRFVYIVTPGDSVQFRSVKVGVLTSGGMRHIIGGIAENERYVVEALVNVHPKMKVKPEE